ncbi:MAG: Ku protein, partial [Aeromicrobium sp.]|nr:Ku protein [Aeromicrobium sp.]
AGDFDSAEFTDEYQEQLRTLVEAKLEQGDALDTDATFGPQEDEDDAEVVDLMEALRRSIDKKKAGSSGKDPAKKSPASGRGPHPAKKAAAKKAPAKKAAAKKAPAKKPAKKAG